MAKDYEQLFNDIYDERIREFQEMKEEQNQVAEIIGRDMTEMADAFNQGLENIMTIGMTEARAYPSLGEMMVFHNDKRILYYAFSNPDPEKRGAYVLEIEGEDAPPSLKVDYKGQDNYCYYEQNLGGDEDTIVRQYPDDEGKMDNNLEQVIDKHIKYLARTIAEYDYKNK